MTINRIVNSCKSSRKKIKHTEGAQQTKRKQLNRDIPSSYSHSRNRGESFLKFQTQREEKRNELHEQGRECFDIRQIGLISRQTNILP
jgi:hypothetical protein